jgi:cyclopropane-fatty-acyl-phospholipid synthase
MSSSRYRKAISKILDKAGISINGDNPYDIKVHNDQLYKRVLTQGNLGLGEAYMDKWWDCEKLDEFFYRVLRFGLDKRVGKSLTKRIADIQAYLLNMQNRIRSKLVVRKHYDIGNDLYMSFLDPYNQYTCGYFQDTDDLNEAQEKKLDLICKKLDLDSTDSVLDIGCGWGGFAKFAAERYGCHVTGITISDQQLNYANHYCQGLPVSLKKLDYRDLSGKFDKILICGMIEHVGYKNYRRIMEVVRKSLKDSGKFLLHTIGNKYTARSTDPWISKYIFPNSLLPSMRQITKAAEDLFIMEDWQNFGAYYDKTLLAWHQNFMESWENIKSKYNERFYRMWEYYLLSCAGSFRARENQLWQIVFTPNGQPGVFQYIR